MLRDAAKGLCDTAIELPGRTAKIFILLPVLKNKNKEGRNNELLTLFSLDSCHRASLLFKSN